MTVQELIEELKKFPPNAVIATESFYDWECSEHFATKGTPGMTMVDGHLAFWVCSEPRTVEEKT